MIETVYAIWDWIFYDKIVTTLILAFGSLIGLAFYGARRLEEN